MRRLDQRVRHPWKIVGLLLAILYVVDSAWSIHEDGWMSLALVPIFFLPFLLVGLALHAVSNAVPQLLDGDARRFRARERRDERQRAVARQAAAGQMSIAAAADGALSDCDPEDRDRGPRDE